MRSSTSVWRKERSTRNEPLGSRPLWPRVTSRQVVESQADADGPAAHEATATAVTMARPRDRMTTPCDSSRGVSRRRGSCTLSGMRSLKPALLGSWLLLPALSAAAGDEALGTLTVKGQ